MFTAHVYINFFQQPPLISNSETPFQSQTTKKAPARVCPLYLDESFSTKAPRSMVLTK